MNNNTSFPVHTSLTPLLSAHLSSSSWATCLPGSGFRGTSKGRPGPAASIPASGPSLPPSLIFSTCFVPCFPCLMAMDPKHSISSASPLLPGHRGGGFRQEAEPLTQDQPALLPAPGDLPVIQQPLLLPEAAVAHRAAVDFLPPVGLLVPGQLGGGVEALAAVEASGQWLPEVHLLVPGEPGSLAESHRTVWAGEELASRP